MMGWMQLISTFQKIVTSDSLAALKAIVIRRANRRQDMDRVIGRKTNAKCYAQFAWGSKHRINEKTAVVCVR